MGASSHKRNTSFLKQMLEKIFMKRYKMRENSKLLYYKEDISVMGKHGVSIDIPFTKEELEEIPRDYLQEYVKKILEVYDISTCYLKKELSILKDVFFVDKKWMFHYLLFKEGLHKFLEDNGIAKKHARFVVIDSGDKKILMILQVILEYANYLTIVTKRREYFSEIIDVVFEETGLMVNLESFVKHKKIEGNVIINLDKDNYRLYSTFEANAYVHDLEFTPDKNIYLKNRRKDLKILYDYDILINGEELDVDLAAEIMVRDNWKLSRFVKTEGGCLTGSEVSFMLEHYQLHIKKLKTIPPNLGK